MAVMDDILREVRIKEGRTEDELAALIFGRDQAYQQRVNPACRQLVAEGTVIRKGNGGPNDPYTYWLPADPPINRRF